MTTIYLTPHCHYDVIWAFNKEDYLFINISIFNKALRMIRDSDFRFLVEQTYLLKMIERRSPDLYVEIEKAIMDGKIEIVDAQYIMADPMVPSGEVLVREILHGKLDCKERFGLAVPVAWAADGFGLNAQLPQIYKKSGYKWVAFRRGIPRAIGETVSEFLWEGLDGTRILTHWMPLGYRAGLHLDKWEESVEHLAKTATTSHILMPCGSGGAIPQEEIPEKVAEWNRTHDDPKMVLTTPSEFFENVEKEATGLFVYKGELTSEELEDVFPDSVSSRARFKAAIRKSETEMILIEKMATLAFLEGKPYPVGRIAKMWRKELFLANHDVVRGCGIDEIYEEPWEYISELTKESSAIARESLTHVLPGKEHGIFIAVFNPNNWTVRNWVEAGVKLGEGWAKEPGIAFKDKEIPSQPVETSRWDDGSVSMTKIGFIAEVPPLSCRIFEMIKTKKIFKSKIQLKDHEIQNQFFKLKVDGKNGTVDVSDLEGNPILKGNEVIIEEELGDLYFHKSLLTKNIGAEAGEGLHFGIFKPEDFSIKKGPVRTEISFKTSFYCLRWPYYLIDKYDPVLFRHKTVEVVKKIIIYRDLPRIDFEIRLNLIQPHVRIRLRYDTCMVAPSYTRQTHFGVLELARDKTLRETHQVPTLQWLAGQEGGRGVAILTHGMPINEIRGGEIFCTLLRSVSVLSADGKSGPLIPTPKAQELGEHSYACSIYPYEGDWRDAAIHHRDFEIRQPLYSLKLDKKPDFDDHSCGISLEPDNLVISAIKKAEADDSVILRFFETKGKECTARVGLPPSISAVESVNLLEEEGQPLKLENGKCIFDVGPFEIVTLRLIRE